MGRKSVSRKRKAITRRTNKWLGELLLAIQQEDLETLTIDDIARLAGKSKSTIYEYFESKEDILLAACKTRTDQLFASIVEVSQRGLSPLELYPQLIEILAQGTVDITISFLQGIKSHYPQVWAVIDDFTDQFVALLKHHYESGIAEGLYNPVSVELLGHIDKLFIIQVVTNPAIFSDEKYALSSLVKDYLNLRLMGLLKREGEAGLRTQD
ncbi:TetR/AcrR family transcriptional regulator [Lewinella sp. W8]|uniref:TetR/AcrR family transcriptional regulator n=1 Tax=Lewinella sp. W8 TaxID=2528208 RepID=UPI0010686487|nr:TetR/AcrR family transcriptional regulator [Lewinella sp. W8]MTB50722.1 TetR family transcriptional regulator [Lewinella sp. W8]